MTHVAGGWWWCWCRCVTCCWYFHNPSSWFVVRSWWQQGVPPPPARLNYNLLLNIAHWLVDLSHNAANTALHWVDICMYLPAFQNFPCLYTVTSNEKVLAVRYIKDLFTACDIQILICVYCVCPTFGWVVNIIQMSWVQHLIEPEGLKWSSKCSPYCLLLWIDNHSIDV